MKKVIQTLGTALTALVLLMVLTGCSQEQTVIKEAGEMMDNGQFKGAMHTILKLSDKQILASDTLMQMLATAYYAQTNFPVDNVAKNCVDLDFTPDGKYAVVTDLDDKRIKFFYYPEMVAAQAVDTPTYPFALEYSPDGKIFAVALDDNSILIYDAETKEPIKELKGHTNRVRDIVFLNDSILYSSSNDQHVAIWNLKSGELIDKQKAHSKNIKGLALSKDRSLLATASNDGTSVVFGVKDGSVGEAMIRVRHNRNYVNSVAISPDNKLLVTASGSDGAKIWDMATGNLIRRIPVKDALASVEFSDDGSLLLFGGSRGLYPVEVESGKILAMIPTRRESTWTVKLQGNDSFIAGGKTHFWKGELLRGQKLIDAANKYLAEK